jgi:predicted O-methyltransferase YrrM
MDIFKRCWTKTNEKAVRAIFNKLADDPHKKLILEMLDKKEANIWLVLSFLAQTAKPKEYLEIGVRRGFSMAVVAQRCRTCNLTGIDLWVPGYGGADNPGPEFVEQQIALMGHKGNVNLITGDSKQVLPDLIGSFDLILVDGDHTTEGGYRDIILSYELLKPGGYIVVDDLDYEPTALAWERALAELQPVHYQEGKVGVIIGG